MTYLLAAETSHVLQSLFLFQLFFSISIVLIVLFRLMFAELATKRLLALLAATPPHFSSPLRLVSPATPVVVFLIQVLFRALFANLLILVNPESLVLQLKKPLLHLLSLVVHLLVLLL